MLMRQFPQPYQELVAGRINATLALDRLKDHGTDAVIQHPRRTVKIVEFSKPYTGHQWAEGILVLGSRRCG